MKGNDHIGDMGNHDHGRKGIHHNLGRAVDFSNNWAIEQKLIMIFPDGNISLSFPQQLKNRFPSGKLKWQFSKFPLFNRKYIFFFRVHFPGSHVRITGGVPTVPTVESHGAEASP